MKGWHGLAKWWWAPAAIALLVGTCGGNGAGPEDPGPDALQIPARGTEATFDVATWNLLWFGSTALGPGDEAGQLSRIRDVIVGTDFDLWGVQEVSGGGAFRTLLADLPGYSGLLANEVSVEGGPQWYSGFGNTELKVGLVYKEGVVEVLAARVVLTELDFAFAGRPPLEIDLRVTAGGGSTLATVLVLHAKADPEPASWERRAAAAAGLKDYLDRTWPDRPVWVIGDWNDNIDVSITPGRDTPYRIFVDAAPAWSFATAPLTAAGLTSMPRFTNVIDHVLVSDEVAAWYVDGSAEVFALDQIIEAYLDTTSDHLPVLTRFAIPN